MGIFDNILGKVKSDLSYSAGSGIASGVKNTVSKGLKKKEAIKKLDKCPKCKAKITDPNLRFCPKCGLKLFVACEKCSKTFPCGTKFCTECGAPLKE